MSEAGATFLMAGHRSNAPQSFGGDKESNMAEQRNRTFRISGHVIDRETRQGLSGLRVEAWDKDLIFNDLVGADTTDQQASFRIEFDESHFREIFLDRRPDLFFKVFRDSALVKTTEDSVLWNVEAGERDVEIEVDARAERQFRVAGQVTGSDGAPIANHIVRAFDLDLRSEELLGETITDKAGRYLICYSAEQFRRAEKKGADVVVRVFSFIDSVLGESSTFFNVPADIQVDLVITGEYRGPSEYERLFAEITPVLQGIAPADLKEDEKHKEITFLHGETQWPVDKLEHFVVAHRLSALSQILPEFYYALLREDTLLNATQSRHEAITLQTDPQSLFYEVVLIEAETIRSAVRRAIQLETVPANLGKKLDEILAALALHRKNAETHAETASRVKMAKDAIRHVSEIAGLSKIKDMLAEKVSTISAISDPVLQSLIADGTLKEPEGRRLGTAASLYNLCDGNLTLVRALGEQVQSARQVAAFSGAAWKARLDEAHVTPPDGMSVDQYAASLADRFATLFPTDAFFPRVVLQDPQTVAARLVELEGAERARLANTYPGLGLGEILNDTQRSPAALVEVIASRIAILGRVREMNPDFELLDQDYGHDSEELKTLKLDGLTPDEQRMALSALKAYQRVYNLAGNVEHMQAILQAGFDSTAAIVKSGLDAFTERTALPTSSAKRYFRRAQDTAVGLTAAVGAFLDAFKGGFNWLHVANMDPQVADYLKRFDGFSALFGSQAMCKCEHCRSILGPAAYFVDLMTFVERNVLDKVFAGDKTDHVLNLKGQNGRRPDLWTLPLTCENTNERIPTLTIVNEVLENFLARRADYEGVDRTIIEEKVYGDLLAAANDSFHQPFVLPLERLQAYLSHFDRTRADVARVVGASDTVLAAATLGVSDGEYSRIKGSESDAELNSLRNLYGIHFELTTGDFVEAFDAQLLLAPMGLTRAELGELVATRFVQAGSSNPIEIQAGKRDPINSLQNDIERVSNLTLKALDRMHRFTRLWRRLPWTIGELDLVLLHLGGDISNDVAQVLDIQRQLGSPVEELCALWSTIPKTATSASATSLFDRLFNLSPFKETDGEFPKPDTRFVHPVFDPDQSPDITLRRLVAGVGVSEQDLVELIRRLSGPLGFSPDASEPKDRGFKLTVDNLSLLYRHARLAERLKLSAAELFQLLGYAGSGGYVSDHASLKGVLSLYEWWKPSGYTPDDLAFVLGGEVLNPKKYLRTHLEAAAARGEPIELQSSMASGEVVKLEAKTLASAVIDEVKKAKALAFADTFFSFLGITEQESRRIIEQNAARIERLPGDMAWRLKPGFDPTLNLEIPDGIGPDEPAAREAFREALQGALLDYHPLRIVPIRLAAHLGESVEKVAALIDLTGENLADAELAEELQGKAPEPEPPALVQLIVSVLPLTVFFRKQIYDPAALGFLRDHRNIFDITDFSDVTLDAVHRLSDYASFAERGGDPSFSGAEPKTDPADLQHVLAGFDPDEKFSALDSQNEPVVKQESLARVVRTEAGLAATLTKNLELPDTALAALRKLDRCAELARYIGISGDTLLRIVSGDYNKLALAANGVLSAFRAKYPNEKECEEKLRPFEDRIRLRKRDALVDYLLHSLGQEEELSGEKRRPFETPNELYYHFLIDVETGADATVSRVVAAISSAQLYVHRCLMNLEQDRRQPGDPRRVHVDPSLIPSEEWVWRKNYRVWEANRKVFLYPENYLDDDIRDNKTPLFEELESELLQQDINEQTVLDAYAKYLAGFEEVATLEIAGVYHQIQTAKATLPPRVPRAPSRLPIEASNVAAQSAVLFAATDPVDILRLFGVTSSDPPTYYYRTVENLYYGSKEGGRGIVWTPWKKINVQIPVRRVAPVIYQNRLHVFWVSYTTRPAMTELKNGESTFTGYQHKMSVKFTTLRLDGTWTAPQEISLAIPELFPKGEGIIEDKVRTVGYPQAGSTKLKYSLVPHYAAAPIGEISWQRPAREPVDGYTLAGPNWEELYVDPLGRDLPGLTLVGRNFRLFGAVDLFRREIANWEFPSDHEPPEPEVPLLCSISVGDDLGGPVMLHYAFPKHWYTSDNAFANLVLEPKRLDVFRKDTYGSHSPVPNGDLLSGESSATVATQISTHARLMAISGSIQDVILQDAADILLFQGSARSGRNYVLRRIGTTITEQLADKLFTSGVDELLGTSNQQALKDEKDPLPLTPNEARTEIVDKLRKLDFAGPYGVYYWEIFFHIPFLIANYLNSQQQFAAAQRWYHYIFDPTASEDRELQPPTDRNWRFVEFRNLGIPKLRKILTDTAAIAAYRDNPFSPHAIARLRPSAYQKAVVLKYIDNLLDWGDSLFAQFTTESVNEATLLYVMAADILGERPVALGDCGLKGEQDLTYDKIVPLSEKDGSEFLRELESYIGGKVGGPGSNKNWRRPGFRYVVDGASADAVVRAATALAGSAVASGAPERAAVADRAVAFAEPGVATADEHATSEVFRGTAWKETKSRASSRRANAAARHDFLQNSNSPLLKDPGLLPGFIRPFLDQVNPVFCIPANTELQAYWDRVEDRLFKIRNSMDISGVRRELALFAPEIDPRLLIRMREAGLSLEDVLNVTSGNLPPYRFTYLIERAKSYAATLQSFGAALLSALEKKDVEELAQLRTVHEQNLLKLNSKVRQWEIEAAEDAYVTLERQKAAAEYRRDYHQELIDRGLTPWETAQQVSRHSASVMHGTESSMAFLAFGLRLMPDVGSPFAMKYGGTQQGGGMEMSAVSMRALADMSEAISASAGLEAGFDRRHEEWRHQVSVLEHELKQIEKQLEAADIRKKIAERSKEVHEKTVEQMEEVHEFYSGKFSNIGLYRWLSTTLQRLHREAYNSVLAVARLAEQAFRFERGLDTETFLEAGYWDASHAGLLAGERLLLDLQAMERRFLETNYRSLEMNQAFSLSQIDPAALVELREKASCRFWVPEFFFDLFYPGHYRRQIKAVRVTIPCVTGPYSNVSATLTLLDSELRREPTDNDLKRVPPQRTVSIATSTAQNDAGVFEFNFRDERYMPFEGAGAVSSWELALPKTFHPFVYQTISDVILHISYTAEQDTTLRERVEADIANIEKRLKTSSLVRMFSLRHEFPDVFHALLYSPKNTPVDIEISDKFFPLFVAGRDLAIRKVQVALQTAMRVNNVSISVDAEVSEFNNKLGGLPASTLKSVPTWLKGEHTFTVFIDNPGDLAYEEAPPVNASAVDPRKLTDILFCVEYSLDTANPA